MIPHVEYFLDSDKIIAEIIYPPKSHSVYFLQSLSSQKTYVGYSVDPFQRLRKHNGEITGGAKRTKTGGPWKIVCIVAGFPDEHTALQFEWKWHNIRRKRIRSKYGRRKTKKGLGVTGCSEGLSYLFSLKWTKTSPEPFSFPLTLWWNYYNSSNYQCQQAIEYPAWIIHSGYF